MQVTLAEARVIEGIGRAVETGRLNRMAPTFTATQLASEVTAMLGRPVYEREVTPILERMGVFGYGKGPYPNKRSIEALLEALPQALEDAKNAGKQTMTLAI